MRHELISMWFIQKLNVRFTNTNKITQLCCLHSLSSYSKYYKNSSRVYFALFVTSTKNAENDSCRYRLHLETDFFFLDANNGTIFSPHFEVVNEAFLLILSYWIYLHSSNLIMIIMLRIFIWMNKFLYLKDLRFKINFNKFVIMNVKIKILIESREI